MLGTWPGAGQSRFKPVMVCRGPAWSAGARQGECGLTFHNNVKPRWRARDLASLSQSKSAGACRGPARSALQGLLGLPGARQGLPKSGRRGLAACQSPCFPRAKQGILPGRGQVCLARIWRGGKSQQVPLLQSSGLAGAQQMQIKSQGLVWKNVACEFRGSARP